MGIIISIIIGCVCGFLAGKIMKGGGYKRRIDCLHPKYYISKLNLFEIQRTKPKF